jgi:hypothetical protein
VEAASFTWVCFRGCADRGGGAPALSRQHEVKKSSNRTPKLREKEVVTRRVKTETLLLLEFVFLRASPPPREILFSASKRLTTVRANAFGFTLHNFEFAGAVDCVHFMGRRYVIL